MKTKLLGLILAVVMVAALFSGCAGGGNQSGPDSSKAPESSKNESKPENDDSSTPQELITVKILCQYWPGDFSVQAKYEDGEYASIQQFHEDLSEYGVKIEPEFIASDSFANVVATRMVTGDDMPDLVSYLWTGNGETDVMGWARNGLIRDVDGMISEYDTDGSIKQFYDEYAPGLWESSHLEDGKLYWFTYLGSNLYAIDENTHELVRNAGCYTLSLRKDWLDKLGVEMGENDIYTPEKLHEVLKLMRDNDANGNGANDELLDIDISSFNNGIAQAYGLTYQLICGYRENEKKVFCNFFDEGLADYVNYMKQLYNEGLIDSGSIDNQGGFMEQNRSAAMYNMFQWEYEASMPDVEGVQYYPIYLDLTGNLADGAYIRGGYSKGTSYGQYFVPTASDNVEGVMRLMDYIYTLRYGRLSQFGVEGKGYTIDENGLIVKIQSSSTVEDSPERREQDPLGFFLVVPAIGVESSVGAAIDTQPLYLQEKTRWGWNFRDNTAKYFDFLPEITEYSMPSQAEADTIAEKGTELETYCKELITDLILGRKSLDDLSTYQAELEKLGINDYIAVFQARLDRTVAAEK